jgi:hypothetical protein
MVALTHKANKLGIFNNVNKATIIVAIKKLAW